MANSKRQTILNYLRDTTIPLVSIAGGYNTDVVKVERGLRPIHGVSDSDLPAVFISRTVENRSNITANQFRANLTAFLVCYVISPNGTTGAQEALDDIIEDVTKAIEQDRTQGGNVQWTEVKSIETDDGDLGQQAMAVIEVELVYVSEGATP